MPPPAITTEQAKGLSLYAIRTILAGRGEELLASSAPTWPVAFSIDHRREMDSLSSGTRVDNREFHFGERYGSDCQAGRGMAAAMLCPSHAGTARRASADPDTVTLPSIRQWDQDTSPRQISVRVRRLLSTVTVTS